MRPAVALTLLVLPLVAGCLQEPPVRELEGPTAGYSPTPSFLKLHVRRDDGTLAALAFDRRDWHVAGIADQVEMKQLTYVSAQAKPRSILNEYLPQEIASPDSLRGLRYDEMGATAEQRAQMDAEYEALLREWLERAPVPDPAATPLLREPTLP